MKMMLWGMFLFTVIGMGSAVFTLWCIAGHNDVTNAEYTQLAKEIVETSVR